MQKQYTLIKAYQQDDLLRESFNNLAKATFSLDFEPWYQQGYWKDNYIPYSILDGDRVIANVSISPMKFIHNSKVIHLIQLGTVMTDPAYRNQGLIRQLIGEVERDYENKTDGYFLFANNSVFEFYPKFGYKTIKEYEYFKDVNNNTEMTAQNILLEDKEARKELEDAIRSSGIQNSFYMKDNLELIMFYVTKFMSDNIYKIERENAYVIAEVNNDELYLYDVITPEEVDLDKIIFSFGKAIKRVVLGFAPLAKKDWQVKAIPQIEDALFVKGNILEIIEENQLRFPVLSHA
jgi:ribosomal protein S18 acetylase RimI-like enzyme